MGLPKLYCLFYLPLPPNLSKSFGAAPSSLQRVADREPGPDLSSPLATIADFSFSLPPTSGSFSGDLVPSTSNTHSI